MAKNATEDVLEYLTKYNRGLTQLECTQKFGNTRLSAIIFNLRKYGHKIDSIDEEHTTRYGKKTTVTRYKLVKDGEQR